MKKYKVGDIVCGNITGITDYGIFVKLEDGYTGMVHISEISDIINNLNKNEQEMKLALNEKVEALSH